MRYTYSLLVATLACSIPTAIAQSTLLESVKLNPDEALEMCDQFRTLNSNELSAVSPESISRVAQQKNLSKMDAEILSIYVIGLHCSDVK